VEIVVFQIAKMSDSETEIIINCLLIDEEGKKKKKKKKKKKHKRMWVGRVYCC